MKAISCLCRRRVLAICNERKLDRESGKGGVIVEERVYGFLERSVPLSERGLVDAGKTSFTNGVLAVLAPKPFEFAAAAKRIPAQNG